MKVLLLADIHNDVAMLRSVLEGVHEEYDILVCVGDFTDFGPVSAAEAIVSELRTFLGFILCVHGNCDPPGVNGVLVGGGLSIAGKKVDMGGFSFYGVGGGTSGPYAVREEDLDRVLREVAVPGGVLISHMPPKGACDTVEKLGSEAVLNIVKEFNPIFVLCGHVHGEKGQCKVGESVVVNPGPVREGNYALIDLETKNVELGVIGNEERKTDKE